MSNAQRRHMSSISEMFRRWVIAKRPPDFVIGGADNPYLFRWFVIPRNPVFNIYLHLFKRDDDDRALHDHPWASVSWILRGGYWEHLSVTRKVWRPPGRFIFRRAKVAHRISLPQGQDALSLFFTGPRIRSWGFHCPKGWVHWRDFTAGAHGEVVGRGCGESETA